MLDYMSIKSSLETDLILCIWKFNLITIVLNFELIKDFVHINDI